MFLGGVASILGGLFILGNPIVAGLIGGTFLSYLIGITTMISGLMMIFAGRDKEGPKQWTWWGLIMGILYILFGIFVVGGWVTHPVATMAICAKR